MLEEINILPQETFLREHRDSYHWKTIRYSLSPKGFILSNGTPLQIYLKDNIPNSPFSIITKEWEKAKDYTTIFLLPYIDRYYWCYINWYQLKQKEPTKYILAPIDKDYTNLNISNLEYVKKNRDTQTALAETFMEQGYSVEQLKQQFSKKVFYTIIQNFPDYQKYQKRKKEIWINFSYEQRPIYEAILKYNWNKDNKDLALEIRWDDYKNANQTEKEHFTNQIVRIKKKLKTNGNIWINCFRQNPERETKKNQVYQLRLQKEKGEINITNKEIAQKVWLKEEQVNNLIRQFKTQSKLSNIPLHL